MIPARLKLSLFQFDLFGLSFQTFRYLLKLRVFFGILLPDNVQLPLALANLGLVMHLEVFCFPLLTVEHRLGIV